MSDQSSHASIDPPSQEQPWSGDSAVAHVPVPNAENPPTDASDGLPSPPTVDDENNSSPPLGASNPQETVISKSPPIGGMPDSGPSNPLEMGVALEGETLGHFHLEKFIGGGGMGAVFRATDSMLNRTVAVKVLSRGQNDEEIVQRFKNEAQSGARLDHDNIARVHYVGEDKGWHYIVFEHIEGLNIRDYVGRDGPLPLETAINFTLQVAEALEHAHQRDVVHRDIKPSNVLVTADGHVKLVDMGLARLHQVESTDHDLTASGVTLGTFDYISPEQARDPRSADVRSDLYSLGCTLYFMLAGRPPFPNGTVLQKLLSHTSDERPDPRLYRPELPEEVIDILNRLLARHPEERFQAPSELIGELLLLVEQLGLHGASHGGTVWITPIDDHPTWWQRTLPIILPIAGLIFAVVVLDRFWPIQDEPSSPPRWNSPKTETVKGSLTAIEANAETSDSDSDSAASKNDSATQAADKTDQTSSDPQNHDDGTTTSPASDAVEPANIVSLNAPNALDSVVAKIGSETGNLGLPPSDAKLAVTQNSDLDGAGLTVGNDAQHDLSVAKLHPAGVEEPAFIPTRLLIVGPIDAEIPVDADIVDTLEEACRRAAGLPELQAIELWFDGPLLVEPFDIRMESLTIRAGQHFKPELVFAPTEKDIVADGNMIGVIGGETSWKGIHFHLRLPKDTADGWSLFHLYSVIAVDLRDCTMTIENAGDDGQQLQQMVAFFEIEEPPFPEMTSDETKIVVYDPPAIILKRCIARGQATLIRAERATPFKLNWEQGLLVTNERLLEALGAMVETWAGTMQVHLDHVTCALGKGICLVSASVDAPHQIHLRIESHNCIFETDPEVALLQHDGIPDDQDLENDLEFNASFCYFHQGGIIWRVLPNRSELTDFRFESELTRMNPNWFNVDENKFDLITPNIWNQPIREDTEFKNKFSNLGDPNSVHTHTVSDYQLRESLNQPNTQSFAGFDPSLLPTVDSPAITPPSATNDAPQDD